MIQFCFFWNTKGLLDAKVDCICIIHNLLDQYRTTPVKPSSLSKEDYSLYSLRSWHLSCLAFILTESVDLNKILENRRLDSCILHWYFERKKEKKERIAKHPTLTAFSFFLFFFPFFYEPVYEYQWILQPSTAFIPHGKWLWGIVALAEI